MKISYDPKADALYIALSKEPVAKTHEINSIAIADINKRNKLVGIELLFAKQNYPALFKQLQAKN